MPDRELGLTALRRAYADGSRTPARVAEDVLARLTGGPVWISTVGAADLRDRAAELTARGLRWTPRLEGRRRPDRLLDGDRRCHRPALLLGMFGLLGTVFPTAAIVPILLYIGLLIGAQAFQATPRAHAAAVVVALVPNIASWATGQIDNALAAAGTTAAQVGDRALEGAGVVYHGLLVLGQGAILAGLVLGAIVAFIIDKRFAQAAISAGAGAALTFVGLIQGEKIEWNANGPVALGYVFVAVVCGLVALGKYPPREPAPDEALLSEGPPPATEAAAPPAAGAEGAAPVPRQPAAA